MHFSLGVIQQIGLLGYYNVLYLLWVSIVASLEPYPQMRSTLTRTDARQFVRSTICLYRHPSAIIVVATPVAYICRQDAKLLQTCMKSRMAQCICAGEEWKECGLTYTNAADSGTEPDEFEVAWEEGCSIKMGEITCETMKKLEPID